MGFSDLSEDQVSWNEIHWLEEAQLLKDWPRLSSYLNSEPPACLSLLQLARWEEEVALEVVTGGQASRWQFPFHKGRPASIRLPAISHSAAGLCRLLHR